MRPEQTEIPNQALLSCALTYLKSAELIEKQNDQLELGAILCSSFSIEILLKSLLATRKLENIKKIGNGNFIYSGVTNKVKRDSQQDSHSYTFLYNKLNETQKNFLASELSDISSEGKSLSELLEKYEGTFIKWRYSFESTKKHINVTELLRINRALYAAIQKLPKEEYKKVVKHRFASLHWTEFKSRSCGFAAQKYPTRPQLKFCRLP